MRIEPDDSKLILAQNSRMVENLGSGLKGNMQLVDKVEDLKKFQTSDSRFMVGTIQTGFTAKQEIERCPLRQGMTCLAYWFETHAPRIAKNQQYSSISGSYKAVLVKIALDVGDVITIKHADGDLLFVVDQEERPMSELTDEIDEDSSIRQIITGTWQDTLKNRGIALVFENGHLDFMRAALQFDREDYGINLEKEENEMKIGKEAYVCVLNLHGTDSEVLGVVGSQREGIEHDGVDQEKRPLSELA